VTGGPRSANEELAALVAQRSQASDSGAEPIAPETRSTLPFLLLRLGTRWFGLRAESVREVVGLEVITRVPGQPAHIRGLALIHGRMVPVVALDRLLGAHAVPGVAADASAAAQPGDDVPRSRMVVLTDEHHEIAILADDARGVVHLRAALDVPTDGERPRFVLGEVPWQDQLVCVLDGSTLLAAAFTSGRA
jgi:purine-binding chemotaxis protein CheW